MFLLQVIVHKLKSTIVFLDPQDFGGSEGGTSIPSSTLIHQSDIALLGTGSVMWINDTQAMMMFFDQNQEIGAPNNAFPFARLASVILADKSTFLYHQMNGTTFDEEQWDASSEAWLPTVYITVSD